ncbi:MAG: M56 family metallopeptidase [Bacteroidetes bacterium]|nr:M56 family metallopeptidase [Bacteroidota bacterium]
MGNQANLLQSLGWAVLNSLWQFALLWTIYKLITHAARKTRPAAKSFLASTLLFAGFAWFVYTFLSSFTRGTSENHLSSILLSPDTSGSVSQWLMNTLPAASVIYLVLLIFPVLRFIRNYRYVQVIRRYGLSKLPADWRLFVNRTALRMGIKKPVLAWVSEYVSSPVTIGFWKPVVLIPMAAMNHLTPAQLEAVLLHELSHIRRFDYLINLLINIVQTVLYFNPFVKELVKTVEREREKSCDELVLQFQYDSHEYAAALLLLEKSSQAQQRFVIAANGKRNDLLHRIETILGVQKKPVISFHKLAGVFAGLLCIIGLNALLILSKPALQSGYTSLAEMNSPSEMFATGTSDEETGRTEEGMAAARQELPIEINIPDIPEAEIESEIRNVPQLPVVVNPEIIQAGLDMATCELQLLNAKQEAQIKEAVSSSKRIFEEAEWKNVESEIAEVFSQKEKEKLKSIYEKALSRFDWKSWETKLRQSYENIDWKNVNAQLANAVSVIRMDSLQRVYAEAISKIDMARSEMLQHNESGIPDSDITIKDLDRKRKDLILLNKLLKDIRTKKVVRL